MSWLFCIGCHNKQEAAKQLNEPKADYASSAEMPSLNQTDSISTAALFASADRKFIRTADVKFKTSDVQHTTEKIENLTRRYNGFVTHTQLTSSVLSTHTIPVSPDSLLERQEYTVENSMTIRVPATQLDSLIHEIGKLAEFIDFRILKADDIHLQLLENTLKVNRAATAEKRYTAAIDVKSKKLDENIKAEEQVLALQNESDSRQLNTLAQMDKVNFSAISLNFYQPVTYRYARLANHQNFKAYKPGLLIRLSQAFATGWTIFEEIILFLVSIWALILGSMVGIWLYKRYKLKLLSR
jgi:hypothetical protein